MNSLEYERLERANENLKAKVLKMKQEYMLLDYGKHENNMRANIMYTTLLIASIIFILCALFYQERIKKNVMIMIIVGLAVIYFGIIIFILMANSKRRKYAWDQYYWQEMKKKS
jgi:undecaprenyl pyrophosphate phosphatase UppP